MSATEELRAPAHRPPRKRLVRRWWFWLVVVVILVLVAGGLFAWQLASRVFAAQDELVSAQALASDLKTQAAALDMDGAVATLDKVKKHTAAAAAITEEPIWSFGEGIPTLGKNLTVVRELAGVTNDLMTDVASPLVEAVSAVDPAALAPKDGAIDLEPLKGAAGAVAEADASFKETSATLAAIDTKDTVDQVSSAKTTLTGLLESVGPLLQTANTIAPVITPTLGSDGPRKYVVMFQNPAESRALGGTALSFAVISIDQGRIAFDESIPAGFKNFTTSVPVLPQPDGVAELFNGELGNFIANNTARPSFTTAALVTQEMWKRDQGYAVDGIISIDPVALSYVLRATGPIPLSTGDVLTSDNLVKFLLNDVYQRFNTSNTVKDNRNQDVVYDEAVGATFKALTSGSLDPGALIGAITQSFTERRMAYWSAHEDEQARLVSVGSLNAEIPISDATTERMGVYFADNVGSKMNFYLNQTIDIAQATCRADGLESYRVATKLTNTLDPTGLNKVSRSILGQWEPMQLKKGQQRMIVLLYAPPGSIINNITVNGGPPAYTGHHDGDYQVGRVVVTVDPGTTSTISYDVIAGTPGVRTLEVQSTPMVNPTPITTVPLDCATVPAK